AYPTGARLALHETASAPFPWRQREFFHDRLSRVGKCEVTITRIEINTAEANPNGIHSIEFGGGGRSHYICEARRASHAQDSSQAGFSKWPVQSQLTSRPNEEAPQIEVMNTGSKRGLHHVQIEMMLSAVDDNGLVAKHGGQTR